MNKPPPKIVLSRPAHPGNIGAAARAMKNMGFDALYLINPKNFPHRKSFVMAVDAADILNKAKVYPNLGEAVRNCQKVLGLSARPRTNKPAFLLRDGMQRISGLNAEIAFVFGSESSGLTNEELDLCNEQLIIPSSDAYPSLNLAQAVQVVCYEWFASTQNRNLEQNLVSHELAASKDVQGMLKHLERMMEAGGFLDKEAPGLVMRHLRNMFHRIELEKREVNILRGVFKAVIARIGE